MIGILGGMGTQAGLDFCNKLAKLNRGKIGRLFWKPWWGKSYVQSTTIW